MRDPVFSRLLRAALPTLLCSGALWCQTAPKAPAVRDKTLAAARELMNAYHYCALVTVDGAGAPAIRTMSPFPPEADMAVWFATNDRSRKALEILKNPRVALYYGNHDKTEGYVALYGKASLVSDPAEINKRKRAYWDKAFPGFQHLVLIKVVPERLEVISYKDGLNNDPETWLPPTVVFPAP